MARSTQSWSFVCTSTNAWIGAPKYTKHLRRQPVGSLTPRVKNYKDQWLD